eukprot:3914076-Rhodomonas_salina.3
MRPLTESGQFGAGVLAREEEVSSHALHSLSSFILLFVLRSSLQPLFRLRGFARCCFAALRAARCAV